METKEKNTGKEKSMEQEELLNKKEVLSDEELQEVAGGKVVQSCSSCYRIPNLLFKARCWESCIEEK